MKAFIICLSKIENSITTATAMIKPLIDMGFDVELFEGTYGNDAVRMYNETGRTLHPTLHDGSPSKENFKLCSPGVKGCFDSHYRLWEKCVKLNETIFIFEDDVEFVRPYIPVEFSEILVIVLGSWLYNADVYTEPAIDPAALMYKGHCVPGTVGYAITPMAAKKLVAEYNHTYIASDCAIRKSVVDIKIHSHLMGRALVEKDGKQSLTRFKGWDTFR